MNSISKILSENGPLTGRQLQHKSQLDVLSLWRSCVKSEELISRISGKRYLRLDKNVDGYARLSPSIMREFLTYTIIGLKKDAAQIDRMSLTLGKKIERISKEKYSLAKNTIRRLVEDRPDAQKLLENACFIIAGDIVYNMAHEDPRPESSTEEMIKGSDLDIVIVTDNLSADVVKELDKAIYQQKYYLMKTPPYNEEIDYVIKDMAKVEDQLHFDSFEHKVAAKLLHEGKFLYGSMNIFEAIKKMLAEEAIPDKLASLEIEAVKDREQAIISLSNSAGGILEEGDSKLFYTREEIEEIF